MAIGQQAHAHFVSSAYSDIPENTVPNPIKIDFNVNNFYWLHQGHGHGHGHGHKHRRSH